MIPHLAHIPALETERLRLRAPVAADFEPFRTFWLTERAQFVGGGPDKDLGFAWRVLATITGHWHLRGFGVFIAERKDTGRPVGSMGPWFPEPWPEQELSWTIWDESAEGQGYAAEALTEIRRHCYADLGWHTAVSYIEASNARSVALAERLGCVVDGEAKGPHPEDVVYRHPAPAGLGIVKGVAC